MKKYTLTNTCVVTQDAGRRIIPRGYIRVHGDTIVEVGDMTELGNQDMSDTESIDLEGRTTLPGLINAHVHLGETLFTSLLPEHLTLEKYLSKTEELLRRFPQIETRREVIAEYSLLLILQAGTTTIGGARLFPFSKRSGLRTVSGQVVMNSDKLRKYSLNLQEQFEDLRDSTEKETVNYPALFIHSLDHIDDTQLRAVTELCGIYPDISLMIHVAETREAERRILDRYGSSSIEVLESLDLISPRTVLIHCNHISESDRVIVKKRGAHYVQCISTNLSTDDGVLELKNETFRSKVSLGTDGIATAGTFSLLEEARTAYIYHNRRDNYGVIGAQEILDMITRNPAQALALWNEIGSIEQGKKADFTILEFKNCTMLTNLPHEIIFHSHHHAIFGSIVAGTRVLWEGSPTQLQSESIRDEFQRLKANIETSYFKTDPMP